MWYSLLADLIVAFHLAYVSYVLVGQVLILLGWMLRWNWVRNLWFRFTHLAMILVVAIEAIFGITCPLTNWEYELNVLAQREVEQRSFIGQWMNDLLFYELPDEDWRFLLAYLSFAALVLLSFVFVPPRVEGYRRTTVAALVFFLIGAMFALFIEPRYLGLGFAGGGLLCWALGLEAQYAALCQQLEQTRETVHQLRAEVDELKAKAAAEPADAHQQTVRGR